MNITLLGTGCPVVDRERYGPAQLIRHGDQAVLVDCGSGVTQRLLNAGVPGSDLDAVLITHLHSDHVVDLFQLVISSWHQGRDRPQRLFGPPGTKVFAEGVMALWRAELRQRIAHERRPSTAALEVEVTEFRADDMLTFGDLQVEAVEVDHKPVKHAFGFVFRASGRRVVLSGDTRPCPALIEAARGADILVHEVFVHREMSVVEGVRSVETVTRVADYHTLSSQVGKVAAAAGAGLLVLTHFVPPSCNGAALLAEVARDFTGPIVIGADLMTFDAESRTLEYGGALVCFGDQRV